MAPTSIILTIRDGIHGREGALMQWGFIPKWAKDLKHLPIHNNARAETISTKPTFKNAFRSQRCIVPAKGFYEWQLLPDRKHKQPYFISDTTGISYGSLSNPRLTSRIYLSCCFGRSILVCGLPAKSILFGTRKNCKERANHET